MALVYLRQDVLQKAGGGQRQDNILACLLVTLDVDSQDGFAPSEILGQPVQGFPVRRASASLGVVVSWFLADMAFLPLPRGDGIIKPQQTQ